MENTPEKPDLKNKVIITAALAGNQSMKDHNQNVPYSPEEFAEAAKKCVDAGASILHLHLRDPATGQPTFDLDLIRNSLNAIKKAVPHAIINLSTSISVAKGRERFAHLKEFKPDMCSLNMNSMNFASANYKKHRILTDVVTENSFNTIKKIAKAAKKNGVKPEIEIFESGGMHNTLFLANTDLLEKPLHFQFVFGVLGGVPLTFQDMAYFTSLLPPDATWSVCGVGRAQIDAAMMAVTQGGHIRVGLEDNVRNEKKELAKGSYEQVQWAAKLINLAGKEVATPDEARIILNLHPRQ
jgi:3-keto-5-aminohexanoate cleavage enzyme